MIKDMKTRRQIAKKMDRVARKVRELRDELHELAGDMREQHVEDQWLGCVLHLNDRLPSVTSIERHARDMLTYPDAETAELHGQYEHWLYRAHKEGSETFRRTAQNIAEQLVHHAEVECNVDPRSVRRATHAQALPAPLVNLIDKASPEQSEAS